MTEAPSTAVPSPAVAATDLRPGADSRRIRKAALLLFVVCAVQFLDAMDIASMGPALPRIQQDLGITPDVLQWVVSAYTLGFGSFLLLGGRLADMFGRKRLLIGWLLIFVAASLAGGLADGSVVLVVARLLKGVSAGFTAPVGMAILLDAFRDEKARNRALSTFLAVATVGYSLGLVLGGLLANVTWRLVMFLPAAVGIVVIALSIVAVPGDRSRGQQDRPRVDVLGALLVTMGAIALVYAVSRAAAEGWDIVTIGSLVGAAVLLGLFSLVERAHPSPLVPFTIFTRPQLLRANVCMLMFGTYVSFQFVLTLFYQNVLGWSPLETGLAFLLGAVLTGSMARYAGAAVTRYGAWPVATVGLVLLAFGYLVWALLIGHADPLLVLLVQQLLGGIGFAAAYSALNIAAVGHAREHEQGLVSGIFNAASQIGAGVVISVTATVFVAYAGHGLGSYRASMWTITCIAVAVALLAAAGIARNRA